MLHTKLNGGPPVCYELTLLHCTALHRTAPHRTAPHRTAPHRTEPHRTAPHHTTLHYTGRSRIRLIKRNRQYNMVYSYTLYAPCSSCTKTFRHTLDDVLIGKSIMACDKFDCVLNVLLRLQVNEMVFPRTAWFQVYHLPALVGLQT